MLNSKNAIKQHPKYGDILEDKQSVSSTNTFQKDKKGLWNL